MPKKITIEKEIFLSATQSSKSVKDLCQKLNVTKTVIYKHFKLYNPNIDHFIYRHLQKDTFQIGVSNSKSIEDACKKLNIGRKLFLTLKDKYNISTEHFKIEKSKITKNNISKTDMENLVKNHNTIYSIFDTLELAKSKENMKWIKDFCEKHNIDISCHFNINWNNKEDVFIKLKNTKYHNFVKVNLIKFGYKEDKCEICGQLPFHNNLPLVLQCHHMDGNRDNNSLENLQILCPNCHTQTDNYAKIKKSQTLNGKVS